MKKKYLYILILIFSCSQNKNEKKQDNSYYDNAFNLLAENRYNEAFKNFSLAKDYYLKQKDSFGAGKCLINMAIIQEKLSDNFGSQETSLSAIGYFDEKNPLHQEYSIVNYNSLGLVSSKLQENEQAIIFYNKILKFSIPDSIKIISQNNLANAYRRKKRYSEALNIYNSILKESKKNKIEYARTTTNFALTKWLQNPKYNPIPEFQKALKIRLKEKDNWGLNSSFAHLSDYYKKTRPDSALFYARKMYDVAKNIDSPDDQIEALEKLISLENPQNSKQYFQVYQSLNDSLQTARNKAKNQFALIRYETEKNKADFLKAKAESTQKQNQIIKQYVVIAIIILSLVLLIITFRKRQKRLQQEKLLEVKNTELKISKKVHDKVANRIYQLMSQVENKDLIDKDALLFGLENAYETSRDISYDNKDINENQSFSEQLHKMLDSYSSDSVKVVFIGNNEKLWEGISFQNKTEVYLVLQELMTNMKKHSQANIVSIKFSRENPVINISYTDNGIGIKKFSPKNGLQNMENRINAINGTIIFDTENNNLLKINITFPV